MDAPLVDFNDLEIELDARHARLRGSMGDSQTAALVVSREANVTYLSGYTTSTWSNFSRPILAVLDAGHLTLIVAETEADSVRDRVPGVVVRSYVELRPVGDDPGLPDGRVQFAPHAAEVLADVLAPMDGTFAVDGLGSFHPPVGQLTGLIPGLSGRVIDGSRLLWNQRLVKSNWELGRIRAAADVLSSAFDVLRAELRPGMTEREIHQRLCSASFAAGADGIGYTNVVAGVQRGLFGAPTDRRWERDDVLFVDGGLLLDGYWADFCRMYVGNAPTGDQCAGYALAYDSLQDALETTGPGTTAADLCRTIGHATRLAPADVGFGRFGHGIGLYMPEPPSVHLLDESPLRDGTVLCVEPAVLHAGGNYVVEEEHVFFDGRPTRLSPLAPPELLVV